MQLHAECLQVFHRRRFLRMTAQQANGAEIKTLTRRGQCMQMIGVGTAQTDDAFGTDPVSGFQVLDEFEPLVATDQRVDLVEAQDRDFDAALVSQPR
jgi:hypothetical protein